LQETETQSNVIRIRVSDLLFALQKRWMIIVALSLVGLTFGLILSAMTVVQTSYQTYTISGSFAVTSKNVNGKYVGGYDAPNINDFHLAEDMVDAVRYVLRSDHVLNEVINANELLGYSIPQLRNAITVTQYNTTQVLEMKIVWRNAEEGVAIWNAIVENASRILPETLQLGSLAVINEAQAEQLGVVGSGSNKVVLLTLLGFSAGIGYAIIELLMHPTLNNVRDVETLFGLETIGIIPRDNAFSKHKGSIMTQEDVGNSVAIQNFSAAAYILRNRLGTKEKHHCFYVTSAALGEGKSTVAANLAIQLSDMEHRVLLIDFDTRNPRLGALFLNKVDYAHSLNALYRGDATEDEAITTLSGYLDLLPAVLEHNAISVDSTLIELVEKLKQNYEYVILDAPAVGVVSGTLSLNQVANTALFVIGYDISTLPEIQSSLEKLYKSGTRVLGCVVNNVVSGRTLGITQTADDYKKSIGKKAREKKREQEKYGFEDDGKPVSGAKKKQKRKVFGKKNSPAAAVQDAGGDAQGAARRNIYEDTMDSPKEKVVPQDANAVVQELVKIGLSGSWDTQAQQAEPQQLRIEKTEPVPEAPSSGDGQAFGEEDNQTPPTHEDSAPVAPVTEAKETVLPSAESALPDRPVSSGPAPAPAGANEPEEAAKPVLTGLYTVREATALLPLFILAAIPVTLAGILLVLAVSAGILAAAIALCAFCASCFLSALTTMPLLQEKLVAIGIALVSLTLGLSLVWLAVRVSVRGISALFRAVTACGRKWCYREVVK
jgi:ATPases involved in chromosome partitioning